MPHQKKQTFASKMKNEKEFIYRNLTESGATLYIASWCGYCKLQKKINNEIHPGLNNIVKEDSKEVPSGINGFPALYIPQNDNQPIIIPGLRSKKQLKQIATYLHENREFI